MDLEPLEKLLYIYLITNEKTDLCGIYEIHIKTICLQTGLNQELVASVLDKFVAYGKIKRYKDYIYIVNFAKNQIRNPSIDKWIERAMNELPKDVIDTMLSQSVPSLYTGWVQDGLPILIPIPILKPTVGEKKSKPPKQEKKETKNFIPPTAEEVQAYCKERGNSINAQYFVDYYETRGRLLKGWGKMKSRQAGVRTRESNANKQKQGTTSTLKTGEQIMEERALTAKRMEDERRATSWGNK